MSYRIAILGNSHTAALKSAWDTNRAAYRDLELVFFAARSSGDTRFKDLDPVDGKLVPRHPKMISSLHFSSGGRTDIVGKDYDAFALIGLSPRLILLPPASDYSAAVRAAMYNAGRHRGLSRIVANIKAIAPDKPLLVAAKALPADPPDNAGPATDVYARSVRRMVRRVFEPLDVVYLPQPAETIVGDNWTRPEYAISSTRLQTSAESLPDDEHPVEDVRHMNSAYGALVLDQLAKAAKRGRS